MNEINFFEQSRKKANIKFDFDFNFKYKKYVLPIVLIVLLFLFIILNLIASKKISILDDNLQQLKIEKTSLLYPTVKEDLLDESLAVLDAKRDTVSQIESLEQYSKVSAKVLDALKSSIPESLFFNQLLIDDGSLEMTGYAKSSNSIAQFQANLEKSDKFYDVFVSDIKSELGAYSFSLSAKVRS